MRAENYLYMEIQEINSVVALIHPEKVLLMEIYMSMAQ